MKYEVTDTWRDQSIQSIMFRLRNIEDKEEYTCGVTQVAINDHLQTEDTIEKAQTNFEENIELMIDKATYLIENNITNQNGHFIITSDTINKHHGTK